MKELSKEFDGRGEVSGYKFRQLFQNNNGFLYEVSDKGSDGIHYEVFRRKENTQFGCVSYPKSNSFGVWAWCITDYKAAIEKYNSLCNETREPK